MAELDRLRAEAKARHLAGEFSDLARAKVAIAREHGYPSWPQMKIAVEAVELSPDQRAATLVRSACSSNVRLARALLAADPALARFDLACACVSGDADAVGAALEREPELARASGPPSGREPILYACFSRLPRAEPARMAGIRAIVHLLLDAGADPNSSFDQHGWRQVPLYGAAGIANDLELTRMLIEAGADPNDGRDGPDSVGEALYHACEFSDPACAELLIEAGTRRRTVDYCLGRALDFPDPAMALMFCAHGARPSAGQVHQAVFNRRPVATVRALLDAGGPIDEPDEHGTTPLQVASRWGENEVAALLLGRGADPARVRESDRALGTFLAGDGEPPRSAEGLGLDAMLDMAAHAGDAQTARRLLDAGAPVDGAPGCEHAPLAQACWRGQPEVVRELIGRGAALVWGEGSSVGAALHGSRHCHDPQGGPTMRTIDEIPREPYAEVVRMLLDAGAPFPHRLAGGGPSPVTLTAELGLDPPA